MRISWKQSSMFWFYWVIAFVSPGELSAWLPPSTYPPLHPPTLYSVFTHSNAMHTPPPTVMQCNACHPPNCTSTTYQRSTQHCAVLSSHPPHHCTVHTAVHSKALNSLNSCTTLKLYFYSLWCTVWKKVFWTILQYRRVCKSTQYTDIMVQLRVGLQHQLLSVVVGHLGPPPS